MGSKKNKKKTNSDESSGSSESDSSSDSRKNEKKVKKPKSEDKDDKQKPRRTKNEESDEEYKSKRPRQTEDERDKKRSREEHEGRRNYRDERTDRRDRNKDDRRDREDRREYNGRRDNRGFRDERNRRDDYRQRRDNRYNDRFDNRNRRRWSRSRSRSFDHSNARWGKMTDKKDDKKETQEKLKPSFALSGKLTEETNTYRGVVIKYSEPPEARKPKRRWRLYPFKGEKALQTLFIHRESAYLIGRDRKVVDLPVDHPSCSKQHAALQYRLVPFTRDDGSTGKRVRPYIIDLDSANGTFINNKKIDPKKYVELLEKDVIKFGFSSREYVLLHENSKDEALDDDVKQEEAEPPATVKEEAE